MANINDTYRATAEVNLWLKVKGGDDLSLADIPSIIPLRWAYFKEYWEFMKPDVIKRMATSLDPDFLKTQIDDFSSFIVAQRNSSTKFNPFQSADMLFRYYSVFDNILIESINLTNQEADIIEKEIARVNMFSKNDFLVSRKIITDHRDNFADTIGLGDEEYDKVYSKSPINKQTTATIVDANFMLSLDASIKTINFILSNFFAVDATLDPFALARANANNPDVDIGQYQSGRMVKLNYGESLESLAARYLNSPNKWIDIAIANGLKPPYIDEVGIQVSLLSNGNGNQINIAGTDPSGNLNIDKFYINQPIFLQSLSQVIPQQRSIVNIRSIPVSGEIILELDGDHNMDIYKVSEQAHIRVYLPNTINSSFYVLIPSEEPLPDNRHDEIPWFLVKSAEDEKRAKVDLALADDGELIFTPNGDVKLSYGIDNAIQAIKLKMITELGTLRYHPTYGLVSIIGKANLDTDGLKDILTQSILDQIASDSRFDRVETLSVDYLADKAGGNAMAITLSVRLAGGTQVIPISFTVNSGQ